MEKRKQAENEYKGSGRSHGNYKTDGTGQYP